jgi:general secretion pathway protein A
MSETSVRPGALYLAHFGLHQAPFALTPDPRLRFESPGHREALAHLMWALDSGGGLVLITGEVGAGKTLATRCFLMQRPASCDVAWILNPRQTSQELLLSMLQEWGATPSDKDGPVSTDGGLKRLVDRLTALLIERHAQGRHCLLLIDEAQHLSLDVLEQLRLLTNLETQERKLLQIVLVGQPELRKLLAQPGLEQIRQRIVARYHLAALSAQDVPRYVEHRLRACGWQGPPGELPFETAALTQVATLTGGIPRWIHLLCDRALLAAYAANQQRVTADGVRRAWAEVQGEPLSDARTNADSTVAAASPSTSTPSAPDSRRARSRWGKSLLAGAIGVGLGWFLAEGGFHTLVNTVGRALAAVARDF